MRILNLPKCKLKVLLGGQSNQNKPCSSFKHEAPGHDKEYERYVYDKLKRKKGQEEGEVY